MMNLVTALNLPCKHAKRSYEDESNEFKETKKKDFETMENLFSLGERVCVTHQ